MSSTNTIDPQLLRRVKALLPLNLSWTPAKAEQYRIQYRAKTGRNLPQTPKAFPFAAFHMPTGQTEKITYSPVTGFQPFPNEKRGLTEKLVFPSGEISTTKLDDPGLLNSADIKILKNAWNEIQSYRLMSSVGNKRETILQQMAEEQDIAIETRKILNTIEKRKSTSKRFETPAEKHGRFQQNVELYYGGIYTTRFMSFLNSETQPSSIMYKEVFQNPPSYARDAEAVQALTTLETSVKTEAANYLDKLYSEYNEYETSLDKLQAQQLEDLDEYIYGRRKSKPCSDLVHHNILSVKSTKQLINAAVNAKNSKLIVKAQELWNKWKTYAKSSTETYKKALKGLENYYGSLLVPPTREELLDPDAVQERRDKLRAQREQNRIERERLRKENLRLKKELERKKEYQQELLKAAEARNDRMRGTIERSKLGSRFNQIELQQAKRKLRDTTVNKISVVDPDGNEYIIREGVREIIASKLRSITLARARTLSTNFNREFNTLTSDEKQYARSLLTRAIAKLEVKQKKDEEKRLEDQRRLEEQKRLQQERLAQETERKRLEKEEKRLAAEKLAEEEAERQRLAPLPQPEVTINLDSDDDADEFGTPDARDKSQGSVLISNKLEFQDASISKQYTYVWNNEQKWNNDQPEIQVEDSYKVVENDFSLTVGGKKNFVPPTDKQLVKFEDDMGEKLRVENRIERKRNPFYNRQLKENEIAECYMEPSSVDSMPLEDLNDKIIRPNILINKMVRTYRGKTEQESSGKLITRSLVVSDSFDVSHEDKFLAYYLYETKAKQAEDVANLMDVYLYRNKKVGQTRVGNIAQCFEEDKRNGNDLMEAAYQDRLIHLSGASSDQYHEFEIENLDTVVEGDNSTTRVIKFRYPPTAAGKLVMIEDKRKIMGENDGDEYIVVMENAGVTLDKVITYNYNSVEPPKNSQQNYIKEDVEANYWKLRDLNPSSYPFDPYDIEEQLKNAIDKLSALGYSHRDIKDENICWDGKRLTLIDFEGIEKFYKSDEYPRTGSWKDGVKISPGLRRTLGFNYNSKSDGYDKIIDPPETWKKVRNGLVINDGCRKSNTCDYYQASLVLMNVGGRMDFINYNYESDPIDNGLPYLEGEKVAFMQSSKGEQQKTLNMRKVLKNSAAYVGKKPYTKQRAAYKFFRYCFFHPEEAGRALNIPPMLVKRIFSSTWIRTGGVYATDIKDDGSYNVKKGTVEVEQFENPQAWRDFADESFRTQRTVANSSARIGSNAMVIEYDSLSDNDIVEIERAMNVFTHEDNSKKRTLSDVDFDNMLAGNSYDSSSSSEMQSQAYSYNSSSDGSANKRSRRAYYDSSSDYSDLNASSYNSSSDADVEDMHGTYDSSSEQSDGHLEMDDSV